MLRNYVIPGLQLDVDRFNSLYFQHDGAPPHSPTNVRTNINEVDQRKVIARWGAMQMPPRSPDLTPMDSFSWDFFKDKV